MLVDDDTVEPERLGRDELVEVPVIQRHAPLGVVGRVRQRHPGGLVVAEELARRRKVQPGHEMEEEEVHGDVTVSGGVGSRRRPRRRESGVNARLSKLDGPQPAGRRAGKR